MPVPRDRVERALIEALNKGGLTNLRTVAASVGLSSPRRFYKDFRDLRLAIVAKNREIRKQRIHLIAIFRPTDASEMAKRWFKSHIIGFPPIKQPLALEAEATRFCVPQENGARKRRKFSYVKWNRFLRRFSRRRLGY